MNVALLIDADNASPSSIDPVLTVLAELGTVNVRRVYGNWRKPGLKGWADMVLKHGLEPYQQFDLTKGKNATDMKMTIDAMDLLFGRRIQAFGIMSSDSDFTPLATRLRQDGAAVYGFGTDRAPGAFRQACTRFIDVTALGGGEVVQQQSRAASPARSRTRKPRQAPDQADQSDQSDDTEDTFDGVAATTARRAVRAPADDPDVLKLIIDAYNASKRDERGYVRVSELGKRAGNRSSFDVRNYGFTRLSDFFDAMPNFQTEKREGGVTWAKRLR